MKNRNDSPAPEGCTRRLVRCLVGPRPYFRAIWERDDGVMISKPVPAWTAWGAYRKAVAMAKGNPVRVIVNPPDVAAPKLRPDQLPVRKQIGIPGDPRCGSLPELGSGGSCGTKTQESLSSES